MCESRSEVSQELLRAVYPENRMFAVLNTLTIVRVVYYDHTIHFTHAQWPATSSPYKNRPAAGNVDVVVVGDATLRWASSPRRVG